MQDGNDEHEPLVLHSSSPRVFKDYQNLTLTRNSIQIDGETSDAYTVSEVDDLSSEEDRLIERKYSSRSQSEEEHEEPDVLKKLRNAQSGLAHLPLPTLVYSFAGWLFAVYIIGLVVGIVLGGYGPGMQHLKLGVKSAWYHHLAKPSYAPQDYIIGPIWSVVYTFEATAMWCVWKEGRWMKNIVSVVLFVPQIIICDLWMLLFYVSHDLLSAAIISVVSLIVMIAATASFARRSYMALILMIFPILWLAFHSVLLFNLFALQ